MKSALPKQFMELHGRPVLMHTLDAFAAYNSRLSLILVLPADDIATWQALTVRHNFHIPVTIAQGGETRFQSVRNGLACIDGNEGLVAVHDGVRPLIEKDIIAASFRLAAVHGSAVAAVRLKESLRVTDQDTTRAVDRSKYRLIQTPQTFSLSLLRAAYAMKEDLSLTDDASVVEKSGHTISLFEGSYRNIKITTPEDLEIAAALIKK